MWAALLLCRFSPLPIGGGVDHSARRPRHGILNKAKRREHDYLIAGGRHYKPKSIEKIHGIKKNA